MVHIKKKKYTPKNIHQGIQMQAPHSCTVSGNSPGEGNVTLVFLPGESHAQRGLAGYRPCGCKESDMTEQLTPLPPASWRSFGKIPSSWRPSLLVSGSDLRWTIWGHTHTLATPFPCRSTQCIQLQAPAILSVQGVSLVPGTHLARTWHR